MVFEKQLQAIKDIDEIAIEYKLDAQQKSTLVMIKMIEISKLTFSEMVEYFKEQNEKKN